MLIGRKIIQSNCSYNELLQIEISKYFLRNASRIPNTKYFTKYTYKTTKLARLRAFFARKIFFLKLMIFVDCKKIHPLDVFYLESFYVGNLEITIIDQCKEKRTSTATWGHSKHRFIPVIWWAYFVFKIWLQCYA